MASLGLMSNPVGDALWALREAVGGDGTLVMPAFNFGFCEGEVFDTCVTPSNCGILSEAFRALPGAVRSVSPPYHGVVADGPLAGEIGAIVSSTSFGRDSVFQYLHDVGARHLLIGCGYDEGVAHFHWLEELREVPYRFWKRMDGRVVENGQVRSRSYFMYARRLDLDVRLDADPLGFAFEEAGVVHAHTVGLCKLRAFSLCDFKTFAEPRFIQDPLVILRPECRPQFKRERSPVIGIDHIGIVSRYADRIRDLLGVLNCALSHEAVVKELGVRCRYYSGLDVKLEMVEPVAEKSCVDGHIRNHPALPLHHIAFNVTRMDTALAYFQAKGYAPIDGRFHADPLPGRRVIFLSPMTTGGLLVELVCDDAPAAAGDET
jgi:aminoglycoside 3-N-acetyltransferase